MRRSHAECLKLYKRAARRVAKGETQYSAGKAVGVAPATFAKWYKAQLPVKAKRPRSVDLSTVSALPVVSSKVILIAADPSAMSIVLKEVGWL